MKKIILLILGILLINGILALDVTVSVNPSFRTGDTITFNYNFFSDKDLRVDYLSTISCSKSIITPIEIETINLEAFKNYSGSVNGGSVDSSFDSQNCTASVLIINPIKAEYTKNFSIITSPSFDFHLILDKKAFVKNENVLISYTSDLTNLKIESYLTYPNGTEYKIFLPVSINADQTGTYEIDSTASKSGYKSNEDKIEFGVIENQANISFNPRENLNIYAFSKKSNLSLNSMNNYFGLIFLILGLIFIFFVIISYFLINGLRRKSKK